MRVPSPLPAVGGDRAQRSKHDGPTARRAIAPSAATRRRRALTRPSDQATGFAPLAGPGQRPSSRSSRPAPGQTDPRRARSLATAPSPCARSSRRRPGLPVGGGEAACARWLRADGGEDRSPTKPVVEARRGTPAISPRASPQQRSPCLRGKSTGGCHSQRPTARSAGCHPNSPTRPVGHPLVPGHRRLRGCTWSTCS